MIILGIWDKAWVPSVEDHEGTFACSAVDPIIVRKLCEWQPVNPIILSVIDEDMEVLLDLLVNSFCLAICLWVPGG